MTALCRGGASSAIPGFAPTVQVGTAMFAAAAVNWPARWAIAYAALLSGVNYNLNNLCAIDPPADPGFTAADGLAMLNPWQLNPVPMQNASDKLQQLLQRYLWTQFCQCADGLPPSVPTPPVAPIGLPDPAPVLPGVPAAACVADGPHMLTSSGPANFSFRANLNIRYLIATAVRITTTQAITIAPGCSMNWQIHFHDASGANIPAGESNYEVPAGTATFTTTVSVPAGAVDCYANTSYRAGGQENAGITLEAFCNGVPPGSTVQPCCPPDPLLTGQLEIILGYVKLIQRQIAPFAYVPGVVHANVTGLGEFAVSGLIGLKLQPTAIPSPIGSELGDPTEYFEMGWYSWGTADGFSARERLTHSPQVSLPADAGAYTRIGFSFPPGLAVTITELLREP
jgi:hypothetical protein